MVKTVLSSILLLFCLSAAVQAQVLYVAAAGNYCEKAIETEIRNGITFFSSLFVENLPSKNIALYNAPGSRWNGPDFAKSSDPFEALLEAVRACPAEGDDGILILWFGKGGFVKNDFVFFVNVRENAETETKEPSEQHSAERRVARSELILALKAKQLRFAGLISESSRQFKRENSSRAKHYTPNTSEITSLMSSLFFEPRGFLDINSSHRTQSSIVLEPYGSSMLEAFGEFLETCDYKAARWTETIDAVNDLMNEHFSKHKQKIEVFSVPKEPVTEEESDTEVKKEIRPAEGWRGDWDEIEQRIRTRIAEGREEIYPDGDKIGPNPVPSGIWSAPLYYPERGDLLIGINGKRILTYNEYIDAIQTSPPLIHLTIIDHRTGIVYEMRTMMGPPGPRVRLGMAVVEDGWGGVRVTGTTAGSPASRCQYLTGYHIWRYLPLPPLP